MIVWIVLSLVMFVPGCMKLFAAGKLYQHRSAPAGMVTFVIHLLHGLLWSTLGVILFFGAIYGNVEINLPLPVSVFLCVVFLADRLAAALESLWIAGILKEDTLLKVAHKKEK